MTSPTLRLWGLIAVDTTIDPVWMVGSIEPLRTTYAS